jgi:MacB-like periplasmic core domain/FtsX-like permease family
MRLTAEWTRLECLRRWRALLALALLVAVSTATVLAAFAGARRGQTSPDRLETGTLPATVTALPNQPGFNWAPIRKLPEVAAVSTFAVAGYQVDGFPRAGESTGFPPGDDALMRTIERPYVLAGRVFNPHRVDEVVVTALFPKTTGKGVGDMLTITLPTAAQAIQGWDPSQGEARGPKIRVHIVGIVRSPWLSDSVGSFGGIQVTPAMLKRYPANFLGPKHDGVRPGYVNALIRLKGGENAIPQFRRDLARVTGRSDIDVWDNRIAFLQPVQRTINYEAVCLLAFGLAALAAALFLVGQSVARYAAASVSDLQLLRAPGITPREATLAASASPLVASVVGAVLGVAGAIVASNWMPIGAASLAEPHPGISADWAILAPALAIVPVLVLLGSIAAARSAVVASRQQHAARRSMVAAAAVSAGAPVPVLIGARFALEAGRGRSALPVRPALVGSVAGVLGVLAAFTFSAGVSDAAANPARFGQTEQLEGFTGENGHTFGPAHKVMAKLATSHDVIGLNDSKSSVAQSRQESITTYTYAPVGGKRMRVVLTAGRMPSGSGEIVLAPTTAKELHAHVGSTIPLIGGMHQVSARVTGIGFVPEGPHNDYDSGAWMTGAGYARVFAGADIAFKFRFYQIQLRPGVSTAAAAKRLNTLAAPLVGGQNLGLSPPSPPQALLEVRDVAVLPFALGAFLALLALGAVGHALATAVRRRRHELAVLRALGVTRIQSRLVVTTQASLLAVIGLLFGVPFGIVLGRVTWRLVAQETPLFYHPPIAAIALALVVPVALLVANLLAAWPGQRAARLHSAQILRAE